MSLSALWWVGLWFVSLILPVYTPTFTFLIASQFHSLRSLCVCVCGVVRARACVSACVRACVCVCVFSNLNIILIREISK